MREFILDSTYILIIQGTASAVILYCVACGRLTTFVNACFSSRPEVISDVKYRLYSSHGIELIDVGTF